MEAADIIRCLRHSRWCRNFQAAVTKVMGAGTSEKDADNDNDKGGAVEKGKHQQGLISLLTGPIFGMLMQACVDGVTGIETVPKTVQEAKVLDEYPRNSFMQETALQVRKTALLPLCLLLMFLLSYTFM